MTLASSLNTLEALREDEAVARHVAWVARQKELIAKAPGPPAPPFRGSGGPGRAGPYQNAISRAEHARDQHAPTTRGARPWSASLPSARVHLVGEAGTPGGALDHFPPTGAGDCRLTTTRIATLTTVMMPTLIVKWIGQ